MILNDPDVSERIKQGFSLRILLFSALLPFYRTGKAQDQYRDDNILRVTAGSHIQIRDSLAFFLQDTMRKIPRSIIPSTISGSGKNILYFDSLRSKASRNPITKRLYDLVVVSPQSLETRKISRASDESYRQYSGKRIRSIEIIKMDVFGTNINNPAQIISNKTNHILNSTHFKTLDRIIRKNLLFSEGDNLSPLLLSDNERILRELPYIDDARIMVVPVSENEVKVIVITKDVYSLGAEYDFGGLEKGKLSVFEKNILGTGHEFGLTVPFDSNKPHSPGFGGHYTINNLLKSFININADYLSGLGTTTYGISLSRSFVSSTTKYAGGLSVRQMYTTTSLDSMPVVAPLKYNLQDYWVARSFLLDRSSVTRLIFGIRYLNNNVFKRPDIQSNTYYRLQRYQLYMTSVALSMQKFYKANLIYGYGRTEDIPYGGLLRFTAGREFNEFKTRTYLGADISAGRSFPEFGYFYGSLAAASFFNGNAREQGAFYARLNYFSNLLPVGRFRSRNFVKIDYSRGIARYTDEHLEFIETNGFSGFSNDSISGTQRLTASIESVLFSPANYHGFRFAFFGFSDLGFLYNSNQVLGKGITLLSLGFGLRVRNDNLLFNTLQIRLAFFPNPPLYSRINNITITGEQLLRPSSFDAGKPVVVPFR